MSADASPARRALRLLPYLLAAAAFVFAAWAGWDRWGDLWADTGRELELPRRLARGERLYSELRWYYGPLAPHVNAVLYRLFGVHTHVLAWAGVASAAALAVILVRVVEPLAGRWPACAVAVAFVHLCAFKHLGNLAIFNWAMPYSYAATYGMLAAAGSLLALLRHVKGGRTASLVASVALLALAALSKVEAAFPAVAAHAVAAALLLRTGRLRWRRHLAVYGLGAAAVAGIYGAFFVTVGPGLWTENLAGLANPSSRAYLAWSSGTSDVGASLRVIGRASALLGAQLLLALGGAWLAARWPRWRLAVAACVGGAVLAAAWTWGVRWGFQALPVLLGATLVPLAWRAARGTATDEELQSALVLSFALAALARIALRVQLDHYGFYLLPVGLAALALAVVRVLPELLRARAAGRGVWLAAALALLAGSSAAAFEQSRARWARHQLELLTPRGRLLVPLGHRPLVQLVHRLEALPPGTTMVALPLGTTVPFLAGVETVGPLFSCLPMELPTAEADRALAARLAARPPDYILRGRHDLSEFGVRAFGQGYAEAASDVIGRLYEPVDAGGLGELLRRRPTAAGR
jgi:hypothetical protein